MVKRRTPTMKKYFDMIQAQSGKFEKSKDYNMRANEGVGIYGSENNQKHGVGPR